MNMWIFILYALYIVFISISIPILYALDPNQMTLEMMQNMAPATRTATWKKGSYGFENYKCTGKNNNDKLEKVSGYVLGRCLHISGHDLIGDAYRSVSYTSCDENSVVIKYCTNSSDCTGNGCNSYYMPFNITQEHECSENKPFCSEREDGWEEYEFNWHLL